LLLIDNASNSPVCGYISDESQRTMIIARLECSYFRKRVY